MGKKKTPAPPVAEQVKDVLVRVTDLRKTFTEGVDRQGNKLNVMALQGVSFDIYPGEFIAITGPNGSGKSTLVNCLGAFEQADAPGQQPVRYADNGEFRDVWQDPEWYRQNFIGIVFQDFHLLPTLDVDQNVEFPLHLRQCRLYTEDATRRQRIVDEALARVGIADHKKKKVNQISGGERQRVAIARALVKEPRLLLADEPTGNLDQGNKHAIVEQLRGLANGNLSVLMVTHDLDLARKADRIIHLIDGRIVSVEVRKTPAPAAIDTPEPGVERAPAVRIQDAPATAVEEVRAARSETPLANSSAAAAAAGQTLPAEILATGVEAAGPPASTPSIASGIDGILVASRTAPDPSPPAPDALPGPAPSGSALPPAASDDAAKDSAPPPISPAPDAPSPNRPRTGSGRSAPFILGCSQSLPDLLRYSMHDARQSKISLATNVFAILLGTFLTAMLLALLGGTEKYIQYLFIKIPGIDSVRVWVDYSAGEQPMTPQEVKDLSGWPGAKAAVASVDQPVPIFQKPAREAIASLFSTQPGDPEVARLPLAAGTRDVRTDGWDLVIPMRVAEELNNFNPSGLAGATITLQLRHYARSASVENAKPSETFDYPVRIVGIVKSSPEDRVYGSLNMVRFVRDFSTGRSDYMVAPGGVVDLGKISPRTLNESLRIHFAGPADAEKAFLEMKRRKQRFGAIWPGEDMLYLRDVQTISTIVLIGIGLLAVVAGAVSIFNTLLASVARKTKEIGIMRALGVARADIFLIFLSQSMIVGIAACVVGLMAAGLFTAPVNAFVSSRWEQLKDAMTSIGGLFQISLPMILAVVGVVLAICLLAAFLPALRAARKTPMDALQGH